MYSLVMMAALTTAPDASAFGGRAGCGGCGGFVVGGCTGYVASSCHGGHGGLFSRWRARWAAKHSCIGSSCIGSSCIGSSCFGSSCIGSSCFGSANFGSASFGTDGYNSNPPGVTGPFGPQAGWAAHGVYYAQPGAIPRGHPVTITPGPGSGCFGDSYLNYSGYGSPIYVNRPATLTGPSHYGDPIYSPTSWGYGVGFGSGPLYYGPDFHPNYAPCCDDGHGVPGTPMTPPQVRIDRSNYEAAKAKPVAGPARLTVDLPAGATLYVDGVAVKGEAGARNFHTPDLPAGQTFYYELKAEVTAGGKTVEETKTVLVKAGEAVTATFPKLVAVVAKEADALAKK